MAKTGSRLQRTAALAVMVACVPLTAAADCTCRALGRDFELGTAVCLATPDGPRLATCGMVLNNTSWQWSDAPCVLGEAHITRVSRFMAHPPAQRLGVGH